MSQLEDELDFHEVSALYLTEDDDTSVEYGGYHSKLQVEPDGTSSGVSIYLLTDLPLATRLKIYALAEGMHQSNKVALAEDIKANIGMGVMSSVGVEFYIPHNPRMKQVMAGKRLWSIKHKVDTDEGFVTKIHPPRVSMDPGIVMEKKPVVLSQDWVAGKAGIYFRCFRRGSALHFEIADSVFQTFNYVEGTQPVQYCLVSGISVSSTSIITIASQAERLLSQNIQNDQNLRYLVNPYLNIVPMEF